MRLGESITETKKVRCSGCRTVIVLTPNPGNPREPIASYPKRSDKTLATKEGYRRIGLYVIFGALCLFMAWVLYFTFSTPATRGSIEGKVKVDGNDLKDGKIRFDTMEEKKPSISATATIKNGHYEIPTKTGPGIGLNKIKITFVHKTGKKVKHPTKDEEIDEEVDRVFAYPDQLNFTVYIKAGKNTGNYEVSSK